MSSDFICHGIDVSPTNSRFEELTFQLIFSSKKLGTVLNDVKSLFHSKIYA